VAAFRIGHRTSAGVVLRAESGIPISGYFAVQNGKLFAGGDRNDVRLPAYVRLDARVQRTFFSSRHSVTLFGEILNALNRGNKGLADGSVLPVTGEAVGFVGSLVPRRVSVGIKVDLRR
jgi:hypothetical protein